MANFSDDEKPEISAVLGQRKRKGDLEYLVRYSEEQEGTDQDNALWRPAAQVAIEGAKALKNWLTEQKQVKKRSSSRSRKSTSRSRSRSSSRSRKSSRSRPKKSQSRSRSRGPTKAKPVKAVEEEEAKKTTVASESASASSSSTSEATKSSSQESQSVQQKDMSKEEPTGRVLRSSTMETRKQLEVQRVHNEQRPTREDDNKPRSAIWKIADYAVIVLFIISLFAALILFLEKFFDLGDFKKQAFPNFGVLKLRLVGAQQRLVDLVYVGAGYVSDGWLYLMDFIQGGASSAKATIPKQTSAPGA